MKPDRRGSYVEDVSDESVSDNGDGALPQGGAVKVVLRVEGAPQHRETDQRIQIENDEAKHGHPQQRLSFTHNRQHQRN